MKRLLTILAFLLLAVPAYADESMQLARMDGPMLGVGSGCVRGATLLSEDWETGYADGEEWSEHNWVELDATTNVYVADDAKKHSGSYSGLSVGSSGQELRQITRTFTPQTGKVVYDVWFMVNDASPTNTISIIRGLNETPQTIFVLAVTADKVQIYNNSAYTNITTVTASQWYHAEVEIDASVTTGIACTRVWIDGVEYGGPYDTLSRRNPYNISRVGDNENQNLNSSDNNWIDDLVVYQGARCVP